MSDSVRPHRRQPTRLLCPWDSPGKNTGVGCHFLLQCMKVKSGSEDPMDCSLPGFSAHGSFQARVLEWGATAFSEGYQSGLLLPTPGDLPDPGINLGLFHILHWGVDSLLLHHLGKPCPYMCVLRGKCMFRNKHTGTRERMYHHSLQMTAAQRPGVKGSFYKPFPRGNAASALRLSSVFSIFRLEEKEVHFSLPSILPSFFLYFF